MPYELRYSLEAVEELKRMRPYDRAAVMDQIDEVLAVNPTLESRARVKRLREPAPTGYRLRVGEFRIFYDVEESHVSIIRILSKEDAVVYLEGD
jgi:mRNA interferase RelE/StbE